jgi:hypothetical protein
MVILESEARSFNVSFVVGGLFVDKMMSAIEEPLSALSWNSRLRVEPAAAFCACLYAE